MSSSDIVLWRNMWYELNEKDLADFYGKQSLQKSAIYLKRQIVFFCKNGFSRNSLINFQKSWYLGGRIRSLSKFKNSPKALISGQKSTLNLIKTLTFSTT